MHDFTDAAWDTRFLGDLYQDLSESARKRHALLQTPEFVEEFILNRTLDPAVEEFRFRTASTHADGRRGERPVAGPVTVRIADRWMPANCVLVPAGADPLVGQVVTEQTGSPA